MIFLSLLDIVTSLSSVDDDGVIIAKKPWTISSDAGIIKLNISEKIEVPQVYIGMEYFIEINVAKEVLGMPEAERISNEMKTELLIFYAENDAYPDWIYQ